MNLLNELFSTKDFIPNGFCYKWKPTLLWLHASSDMVIALAYFAIPITLIQFLRKRRDLPFSWMFVCFGVFFAAGSAIHVMDVWTLWVPSYWFSGGVKVITALASIPTAVALVQLMPQALSIPSPEELRKANEELKRQSGTLKKSEERFRQMAENIQEIFLMMDPATKQAIYASPAFEQICELPRDTLYSNPACCRELIHPEDRGRVLTGLEKLETTNRFDEEFRIVCPSQAVKWLRAIGFQVKDSTGIVQTFVGTVQDITTRKELEVALRGSEDLLRDLVEHSSDLICTHSLEGRLLSVNELPVKLLGYSKEELLNKPMREFLLPEARAQFDDYLLKIKRDGFAKGVIVVPTNTGEGRIWEYHNTLRTDGVNTPIVRGIAHDITEQKRMEKALRLMEEKFSKALLASPYAVIISTIQEGRLIEVSDSFLRVTGLSRKESIGHTAVELGLWNGANVQDEILSEIQYAGRVRSKEITCQTKEGKQLAVNYSATVIELGGRRCLLSVCEDITERKRAEERLREYEKALEGVEAMIAVVDREYRYLLANHSLLNARGLKKEEVVGRLVSEVIDMEYFELVAKERLDEAFLGKIVKYETRYTYPQIGQREILVSCFPIAGAVCVDRVVCVLQDISDRTRAEAELRRLSGQLLHSQDEERRKIARDLHDTTGQELVALVTILSQLHDTIPSANRTWRKLASQCQAIAERSLREVRTLSYLLHPPMLDASGLEAAIRHYVDGFGRRTCIDVDLEISPHFGRLPQDLELGLFRVVQESLTNIQRHSGSFTAKLQLNRNPGKIFLAVSDTGRGMCASEPEHDGTHYLPKGVGIPSMEERVKQIGGRLEIESSSKGTIVRVAVPYHD